MAGACIDVSERKWANREKEKLEENLIQARKMESVGRLAGGIAHDFNNMLSPIMGYSELIIESIQPEDPLYEYAMQILKASKRARDLTQQLLAFSRKQPIRAAAIDLAATVRDFERILRRTIREDIALKITAPEKPCVIKGDVSQLEQVLMNLALNAQDAMPSGGTMTFNMSVSESDTLKGTEGLRTVILEVGDTGQGMNHETLSRIFEPFFTTKEYGKGTGLGLSIVYGLVKQHGGEIDVESIEEGGTVFRLRFPALEREPEHVEEVLSEKMTARGGTVVVVEDNDMVRNLAAKILNLHGYKTIVLDGPERCLSELDGVVEKIDLLLTDVVMPAMNGVELYSRLSELRPGLKVLYMSGYSSLSQDGLNKSRFGVNNLLRKPFTVDEFVNRVREAMEEQG